MKKIILLLYIIFPSHLFAIGFNSIHSPDGINIFAVGDSGKIYRSSNSGNGWFIYNYSSNNLKNVCSNGNDVWFAGDFGKIYKTNLVLNPISVIDLGNSFFITSILFINSNTGFVCGNGGRVYKSINGGSNWNLINSGLDTSTLNSISFKDEFNGVVVSENGKIYTTINGGTSWTLESISSSRKLLKVKYYVDGILVSGEYGTLLLKPNFSSWSQINTNIISDIRGISGTSLSETHICGGGGFIRNNKSGSTNFLNFEINPMMANLVDIFYFNSSLGFAVSSLNKAVIKTTNSGLSWELPNGATVNMTWQSKPGASGGFLGQNLCNHPTNRNTIFTNFSGRTYVSRNRGETWTQVGVQIPGGTTPHSFYVSPLDTNIWMCAIEASGGDRITRSTDYGQSWNTIITRAFSNYGEPLQMDQNNPHVYYFGPDGGGFYKSTDNGISFTEISGNYPFRSPCDIMVSYEDPNILFLADGTTGSDLAELFKSTNGGVNWTLKFSNPSSSEIPTMCNTIFKPTISYITNWPGGSIFKSTTSGESWELNNTNSFSGWGSDISKEDPNVIMTGSWSGNSTSLSTNGGANWITTPGLNGSGGVMVMNDRGYNIGQAGSSMYKLNVSYSVVDSLLIPLDPAIKINMKIIPEGFYYPLFNQLSRKDSFTVYLRRNIAPYSLIDSAKSIMDSLSLTGLFRFVNALSGTYYIAVNHLNSIETWSKAGGEFLLTNGTNYNYDFTTSSSQAYGDNLTIKSGKYCIYSGDVNQDGFITLFDVIPIYNDAANFISGRFILTDLTGDNIVDLTDVTLCYNNSAHFIAKITP